MFEQGDSRHRWPEQDQLAMEDGISGKYKMDRARLDSRGGPQRHPAYRGGRAPGLTRPRASAPPPERPADMSWPSKRSRRVAAPLEQVPTLFLGIGQQPSENRIEEVAQFLGPLPTTARQPFSQRGEAGDIEQQQASIDDTMGGPRLGCCPHARQEAQRHIRRRGRALPDSRQQWIASGHCLTLEGWAQCHTRRSRASSRYRHPS